MFIVNVEGAIEKDGRYLMIVRGENEEHAPGALSFPGGKVEWEDGPDTALESALRRELLEEVGVEIDEDVTYVESRLFEMDDGRKVLDVVFLCHPKSGTPAPGTDEVESVRWMSPDQILRHAPPWLTETNMRRIEKARDRIIRSEKAPNREESP